MRVFEKNKLKMLYKPPLKSSGEDNGQITVIGGSKLFHGAPLLSLKVASRIVDMVFLPLLNLRSGESQKRLSQGFFHSSGFLGKT